MSGMAALLAGHTEPGVYRWHNAAAVADVQHAVETAGWTFRHLDGWTVEDKHTFLKSIASELEFPAWFGENLDALADCLGDVAAVDAKGRSTHGIVLLWDGWSPLARHDEETFEQVLDVLRERADSARSCAFAVCLRGEGPDLSLPELPIKH